MRGLLFVIALLISGPASADIFGSTPPPCVFNCTISYGNYGLNQDPFSITGGGSGYALGDYITLTCPGCTATTSPTIVITSVSGGVITGTQVRQSGVFTRSPTGALTFTQVSTSGTGTGATFSGSLGPIASILSMPALGSGGGSGNGNLLMMGAEGPCSNMLADESTHYGDKAGLGLGVGANNSNALFGHNVAGNGAVTCAAHLDGSFLGGADAARNIQGTNSGIIGGGPSAWRNINGATNNVGFGVQVGINCTSCSNNGLWATSAPTLTTGNYNLLFGPTADVATGSTSNTIQFAGQFGPVLSATGTNSPGATNWTLPGVLNLTGDHGASSYDLIVNNGAQIGNLLTVNGLLSLGCCAQFQSGLGSVNHLNGPADHDWNIVAGVPAQATTAVSSFAINISTPNALAGTSVDGGGQAGGITLTAGNAAARNPSSFGVSGGSIALTAGRSVQNNNGGGITLTTGATDGNGAGAGGVFTVLTGTPGSVSGGHGNGASGAVSIQSGIGGAVTSNGNTSGNSGAVVIGSLAGGANSGSGGTAGNSGATTVSTGAGGTASGASGTRNGGNSGTLTLSTGAAGTGASANGTVGSVIISPGGTTVLTGTTTLLTAAVPVVLKNYTVATLPTCSSTTYGFAAVSDATAPTYNGALIGSGAAKVPVFCDGSAWTSH